MEAHQAKGIAAKTVSTFLEYCFSTGMVDEILSKHYKTDEVDQIKAGIQEIADDNARSADYHKRMMEATT